MLLKGEINATCILSRKEKMTLLLSLNVFSQFLLFIFISVLSKVCKINIFYNLKKKFHALNFHSEIKNFYLFTLKFLNNRLMFIAHIS